MPLFSKDQIAELIRILNLHSSWLVWRLLGDGFVTKDELDAIKRSGILPTDASLDPIQHSFVLGRLESLLKTAEWKNLTFDQLKEYAVKKQTPVQEMQIESAKLSSLSPIRNLQKEIERGFFDSLSRAANKTFTEAQIKEIIANEVKLGVEKRKSYLKVAEELAHNLKEYGRNWSRVASTEMHRARQQGAVDAIVSKEDIYRHTEGVDSDVAVVPQSTACEECVKRYRDPKTGGPRVFKLKELLANAGTNYIKPWRKNAKPVVPPLHPNSVAEYAEVQGNVLAATRMAYTGLICEIETASGKCLPVTPNHLVATRRGFIPAKEIVEGDYLLSYESGDVGSEVSRFPSTESFTIFNLPQNNNYGPTQIKQVFETLMLSNFPISVPRLGFEFHGDAAYGQGNIDIVYADGVLGDRDNFTLPQHINHLLLKTSEAATIAISHQSLSDSFFMQSSVDGPCTVASQSLQMSKIPFVSKICNFGSTSELDSELLKMRTQFSSRDASFCGNLQQRLPVSVLFDQVVNIRNRNYSGHVYDLQTISEVIVVEGCIVSNCFCRVRYLPPGWIWNKKGYFMPPEKEIKKAIEQGVDVLKKSSHSGLLSSMTIAELPTKEEIHQLKDLGELQRLIHQLHNQRDLFSNDSQRYYQLDNLIAEARRKEYFLRHGGVE